jgi:hypothetical protein
MKQIIKDGTLVDSLFYVGKVGKYFWDKSSNKALLKEALEHLLLKNMTQYSGCDGYIHNILEVYLFHQTQTIFDCIDRDYKEIISDDEYDLIDSDEYFYLTAKARSKNNGKEYSLIEIACLGKDGAMHSFNGSGCALLIDPENNEPIKADAQDINETIAYMAKTYTKRKLIHQINGIDIYMVY